MKRRLHMESNVMTKPTVFISYSHKDEKWKDRLVTHLGVLKKRGFLTSGTTADWSRRGLASGNQESNVFCKSSCSSCLADFLSSNFILGEEVRIFWSAGKRRVSIFSDHPQTMCMETCQMACSNESTA